MATQLEETPDYREAHAKFVADTTIAERNTDETSKLRAELDWERTRTRLEKEHGAVTAVAVRREAVLAEIKKDYPAAAANKVLLEHITDPDALLEAAKEIQKQVGGAGGDWGTPGGSTGSTGGGDRRKERRALIDRVNTGSRQAIDEYKKTVMEERIIPFIERQNQAVGRR